MISSNPYHPLTYSRGITHTWMGESWMVDGVMSVMVVMKISSKSPSRQGARTEFLVPNRGFWWRRRSGSLSRKNAVSPIISRQGVYVRERGGREEAWGHLTQGWRGQGWATPPPCDGSSSHFSLRSSGSMGLLVKYDFSWFFPNFYWKLNFCTKTRHQSNSAENSVSPC